MIPEPSLDFAWPYDRAADGWTRVTGDELPQPIDVKFQIRGIRAHITAVRIDNEAPVTSSQLRHLRLSDLSEQLTNALMLEAGELSQHISHLHDQLENSMNITFDQAVKFYLEERDAVLANAAEWSAEGHVASQIVDVEMEQDGWQSFVDALSVGSDVDFSKRGRGAKPPTIKELEAFAAVYRQELEDGERGAKSRTARRVGMDRTTVYRWIPMCTERGLLPRTRGRKS